MSEQTAQKNEAVGIVEVDFRGHTFRLDREIVKDLDVIEAIEKEHLVEATKAVLGPEQWAVFRASKPKPNADTVVELFEVLGQAFAGASAGE